MTDLKILGAAPDIFLALLLIVIAVVAVVITNMGVLPKKSLPFILGGLAGIFGFALFKKSRDNALREQLKLLERKIKDREKTIAGLRGSADAADTQRTAALADLQRQEEALRKELLLNGARTAAERDKISKLQGDELLAHFDEVFGGE